MYKFQLTDPQFLPHSGCDVSFNLKRGELLTIVGENGLGKTTLAQRFWSEHQYPMTLIEQKALDVFYDRPLSKIKNILLEARRDSIDETFFHSLWKRFGLVNKEARFHSHLSGGEGQALKLCLGLAQKAEIYIIDEPSQFLDQQMKSVLSEVIAELIKKEKSILLIEHDYDWVKVPTTFIQLGNVNGTIIEVKSWTT